MEARNTTVYSVDSRCFLDGSICLSRISRRGPGYAEHLQDVFTLHNTDRHLYSGQESYYIGIMARTMRLELQGGIQVASCSRLLASLILGVMEQGPQVLLPGKRRISAYPP
jgi:hypothetical protein